MKTIRLFLIASLALLPVHSFCADNAYDTVGKLLMPFVGVLAEKNKQGNRAVTMTLRLEGAADKSASAFAGSELRLAFEYPDKLRIDAPLLDQQVTICRKGQKLWAAPGTPLTALLNAATRDKKLPPLNPDYELAPFRLPIPEKQLIFLPVLFQVRPVGAEEIAGEQCQVLDLQLMPELERSLKEAKGWSARVWVRKDSKPAQLTLTGPETTVTVRFVDVQFQKSLPPETWKPAPEQDVLKLEPARFDQLVRTLLRAR